MSALDPNHTSFYSPRTRKWLHQAQEPTKTDCTVLYPTNKIEYVIPPSRSARQQLEPHSRVRRWWSRCLAQDAPEFGAALDFIDDFLEESHVVSTHTELTDPTIGNLLAFGTAQDVDNKSSRLLDIAAFASGPIGADLSVGAVKEKLVRFSEMKGMAVAVPRIFQGAEVAWSGGSTIRQIVFAGGVGQNAKPYLAVRAAGSTTVLKHTRLQLPVPGQMARLAANPVVEVYAGQSTHAHVEFNPWYERQFAIIDENGKWKIWDIEGRQSRDARIRRLTAVVEYTSGHVPSADDNTGKGWGRIVWGGDLYTVLACDRRRAGLFDIRSPQKGRPDNPILANSAWIRDLKHSPSFESGGHDAFVLTSTDLAWIDMRQSRKPLMSVPHRRHWDDHTLSMELFDTKETVMTAFLHSRSNSLITTHCFTSSETPALLGPPRLFHSPISSDATAPVSFGFGILPCRLVAPDDNRTHWVEKESINGEDLRFFTGFAVGKELGIAQRIYATQDLSKQGSECITRSKRIIEPASYVIDSDDDEAMEIEMRGLSFEGEGEGEGEPAPFTEFGNSCVGERYTGKLAQTRTNFNALYRYAFTDDTTSFKTVTDEDIENSIDSSVRRLRAILQKRASQGDLGIISLLNLQQPTCLYDRLDDFETRIRELLAEDALSMYKIKSLIPASDSSEFLAPADTIAAAEQPPLHLSITSLYNKLIEIWVRPLPRNTPGIARLRRERLCRMLATETWLSSIGLHLEPSPESLPPPPVPIPTLLGGEDEDGTQIPPESLPEPLQRIRTYANVSTRITLPEGLQGVLDKWEVGEDPWEYEYALGEQAGEKSGRVGKRSHRRKRGKVAVSAVAAAAHGGGIDSWRHQIDSQPPAIMVGSQPTVRTENSVPIQRSSQFEGAAVMSQVERGKNGGRLAVAARKKRKTGF